MRVLCAHVSMGQDSGRRRRPLHRLMAVACLCATSGLMADTARSGQAKSAAPAPPKPAQQDDSRQPARVTNVWVDMDLRTVTMDIAAQTKLHILAGPTFQGVVSLEVKDMPLGECLDRLCALGDYAWKKVDDYYVIGSADPNAPLFAVLSETKRIDLNYVDATVVRNLLPPRLARYVQLDAASGTLLAAAPSRTMKKLQEVISLIDIPAKQVVVEALVVELSEDGSKDIAIDWRWQSGGIDIAAEGLMLAGTCLRDSESIRRIDVALRAIVRENKARVLANPRVTALDGQQATIFVGADKYYTLLSGHGVNPYYTLETITAGITLKITPHIGAGDQMTLDLGPEASSVAVDPDSNGNKLPVITRREASTKVQIRSGQTIVIGGLLHEDTRKVVEKVPLLGDIPLLGLLFRKSEDRTEQKEVVIFICPRLLSDAAIQQDVEDNDLTSLREDVNKARQQIHDSGQTDQANPR